MKIIAQSTVSTKMPYLHLAYTAATMRSPQGSILTLGILMLVIGLVLTFKTSARKTKRGFTATHIVYRKMSVKKLICCFLFLVVGGILLFLSFVHGTEAYLHPKMVQIIRPQILGSEFSSYREGNEGRLPDISKWCDDLLKASGMSPEFLLPPDAKFMFKKNDADKVSYYAMNANLASLDSNEEIPPDVVVLFEAKQGWNQAGGPELINTDLGNKSGCFVLLGDGEVKFVKKEEINKLRWDIKDE